MHEKVEVKISKKLFDEIQGQVDESGGEFKTVSEYVEFVLAELLRDENEAQIYTQDDEEEIKKRLRELGYIE